MKDERKTLSKKISAETGINSARCYQCGKCSAGCPLANDMDITSSAIMRMLQVEEPETDETVLRSQAIWLCASCEMCISRCPMQIDIPKIMDNLRQESVARKMENPLAGQTVVAFHRSFLDMVRTTGKSYEIGLVVDYKLRSKKFFQDLILAPKMFFKGKLPIVPETVKDKAGVRKIFTNSSKKQG